MPYWIQNPISIKQIRPKSGSESSRAQSSWPIRGCTESMSLPMTSSEPPPNLSTSASLNNRSVSEIPQLKHKNATLDAQIPHDLAPTAVHNPPIHTNIDICPAGAGTAAIEYLNSYRECHTDTPLHLLPSAHRPQLEPEPRHELRPPHPQPQTLLPRPAPPNTSRTLTSNTPSRSFMTALSALSSPPPTARPQLGISAGALCLRLG